MYYDIMMIVLLYNFTFIVTYIHKYFIAYKNTFYHFKYSGSRF